MSEPKCTGCDGLGVVLEFRPGRHPDDACEEEVDCPDCEGSGSFDDLADDGPSDAEIDDAQNAWESRGGRPYQGPIAGGGTWRRRG